MKRALLGVAALSLALSACGTSNDRASSTDAPDTAASAPETRRATETAAPKADHDHEATVTTPPKAVSDVKVSPGQAKDGFVGAASDAKLDSCAKAGSDWKVSGSVKNPTAGAASYRIYVAMNAVGTTETRALKQIDVTARAGETKKWSASAPVSGKLSCILRVERTAAS